MKTKDTRALDHNELTALRRRGVEMLLAGRGVGETAAELGVHRATVSQWLRLHRQGGDAALEADKRGGRAYKLDAAQHARLFDLICDHLPADYGLPHALWWADPVAELALREFGVTLTGASRRRLTRRLGLKQPVVAWTSRMTYRQVREWLETKGHRPGYVRRSIWSIERAETTSAFPGASSCPADADRSGFMLVAVTPKMKARFMLLSRFPDGRDIVRLLKPLLSESRDPLFAIDDTRLAKTSADALEFVLREEHMRMFVMSPYPRELSEADLRYLRPPERPPLRLSGVPAAGHGRGLAIRLPAARVVGHASNCLSSGPSPHRRRLAARKVALHVPDPAERGVRASAGSSERSRGRSETGRIVHAGNSVVSPRTYGAAGVSPRRQEHRHV